MKRGWGPALPLDFILVRNGLFVRDDETRLGTSDAIRLYISKEWAVCSGRRPEQTAHSLLINVVSDLSRSRNQNRPAIYKYKPASESPQSPAEASPAPP